VGWVDLSAADVPVQLAARAREPRFVGVRPMLQDLSDPAWILKDEVSAGLQVMQSEGLVFDALIRWRQLPTIIELAERYTTLSIVLDHAGKPPFGDHLAWRDWETQTNRLARLPNVACKLSGLLTELPESCGKIWVERCVDVLLDHFGPQRVLWGSDWPVATLAAEYADWLHYCQEHIRRRCPTYEDAVFGGNAQRIYRL
jgi:L-fuconolactonase